MAETFERVLVANRGTVARRLVRMLAEEGLESVAVFHEGDVHEGDVEQPWVEEADFPQYLNGAATADTYLDPSRMVAAAMDTGCEMLHPGVGYLAEDIDLHATAARANVGILGVATDVLKKVYRRFALFQEVQKLAIPAARCSEDMPSGADVEKIGRTAGTLGYPLVVRAAHASVARRVDVPDALLDAVAAVRADTTFLAHDRSIYLEGLADGLRTVRTVIVGDRRGSLLSVGSYADSVGLNGAWWLAEMGRAVASDVLRAEMIEDSVRIAEAVGFVGVGSVRWVVTPSGQCFFGGLSIALPEAWPLADRVLGVDLARTGLRIDRGERLGWDHYEVEPDSHGIVLRLVHLDADTGERPEGLLERLDLPEGPDVQALAGAAEGVRCSRDTDPVLAELIVLGPTRQAALVKARSALEAVRVEGVPTNRDALLALMGGKDFWQGRYDIGSIRRALQE